MKLLLACILIAATASGPVVLSAQEKAPRDQREYELINRTFAEANPYAQLQLLDDWAEKYPTTAFDEERLRQYMAAYQATNQGAKAVATAQEILTRFEGDFGANFTIASLTPFLGADDAATYDDGVKAAKALLTGGIDKQFAPALRPAPRISEAQWDDAKKQAQTSAHQTIGWVAMVRGCGERVQAMMRKEYEGAEKEFSAVLKLNPASAQVSYWLAQVVLAQAKPDKNALAIFSFARAATYDGPGALAPEGRQKVDEYLTQLYTKFAGTEEGLSELKAKARGQAFPPEDLYIKPAAVRKLEKERGIVTGVGGTYAFAPESGWKVLASWSGNGPKNTDDVVVSSGKWRIRWKASSKDGAGSFSLMVHKGDDMVGLAANIANQSGGDTTFYRGAGMYWLEMGGSAMNWTVVAEEEKSPAAE